MGKYWVAPSGGGLEWVEPNVAALTMKKIKIV